MLIKAALEEIMKSTCIKFIPRTKKEDDYIVFMEYKALSQARGFVSQLSRPLNYSNNEIYIFSL